MSQLIIQAHHAACCVHSLPPNTHVFQKSTSTPLLHLVAGERNLRQSSRGRAHGAQLALGLVVLALVVEGSDGVDEADGVKGLAALAVRICALCLQQQCSGRVQQGVSED